MFGYAPSYETTVREAQQKLHGGQCFKGKSLDGHGPMGPWIVTAAGVQLGDLRVICRASTASKSRARVINEL